MSRVIYNEIDRRKAAWLRHLIEEGEIAHGIVDERSIAEIQPEDLRGVTQFHAFAGIGIWSLCLRRAGWPDDRPVWTGSCPCGPFTRAGLQKGFEDPRHLWPEWERLVGVCRPPVIFGEQSEDAREWLDLVSDDLEARGFAVGSIVLPAASFGGAHERHRIGFVADYDNTEWWSERAPWNDGHWPASGRVQGYRHLGNGGQGDGMGNADCNVSPQDGGYAGEVLGVSTGEWPAERAAIPRGAGPVGSVGDASVKGLSDAQLGAIRRPWGREEGRAVVQPGDPLWAGVDWLLCRDSRWRPVEPGLSPLVDADPARMGRLRGYGDAIDVEAFTNLIGAYMDVAPPRLAAA